MSNVNAEIEEGQFPMGIKEKYILVGDHTGVIYFRSNNLEEISNWLKVQKKYGMNLNLFERKEVE